MPPPQPPRGPRLPELPFFAVSTAVNALALWAVVVIMTWNWFFGDRGTTGVTILSLWGVTLAISSLAGYCIRLWPASTRLGLLRDELLRLNGLVNVVETAVLAIPLLSMLWMLRLPEQWLKVEVWIASAVLVASALPPFIQCRALRRLSQDLVLTDRYWRHSHYPKDH